MAGAGPRLDEIRFIVARLLALLALFYLTLLLTHALLVAPYYSQRDDGATHTPTTTPKTTSITPTTTPTTTTSSTLAAHGLLLMVFDGSLPSYNIFTNFVGAMSATAYFFTSLLIAPCIWKLAARSAKCADYASSIYVAHLLLTWYADGFPTNGAFYLCLVVSGVISALVSERLALREELAEIPLDRFVASKKQAATVGGAGGVGGARETSRALRIEMV